MRRGGWIAGAAAALALPAAAQAPSGVQANLQSAGTPLAPVDPASAASSAAPPAPSTAEPVYAHRDGVACGDFKRAEAGGWSVVASVQFPGPAGPVKLAAGQTIGPGDYVSGLNLAAVLQRECPQEFTRP